MKLATLNCYFAWRKYDQCVKLCDETDVLKGKALYHMYQRSQWQLRMCQETLQPRDFFIQHKTCYNIAKEAVKIFSHARANGHNDAVSNKMLDFAMMDYLFETNKLKELNLCFLCLEKPKPVISKHVQPQASSESEWNEPIETNKEKMKPKQQKGSIRASHLFPHGIISRLANSTCALTIPGSKNILFGVSGTKLQNVMKRTPATSTIFMLCPMCEHNLNVLGEESFFNFFEKLYTPLYRESGAEYGYGGKMYHFCIGLIFRTLCPSQDDYINTDEVYQLLLQCRAFLTADSPLETVDKFPRVFMLLCSISREDYGETFCTFIEENLVSYTSKISLDCRLEELGTFVSVFANFFMVKLGIVILVVKFAPTEKLLIDERFCISPKGGSYPILTSAERRELIPTGIWTALHILCKNYESDIVKAK